MENITRSIRRLNISFSFLYFVIIIFSLLTLSVSSNNNNIETQAKDSKNDHNHSIVIEQQLQQQQQQQQQQNINNGNNNTILSLKDFCKVNYDTKEIQDLTNCKSKSFSCPYCQKRTPSNQLLAFNHFFSTYVQSQDFAVGALRNTLVNKIANENKPTVILSTGDHGLGKTSTARLYSKVLFKVSRNEMEGDGLFMINGEEYARIKRSDEQGITKARNHIHDTILKQLIQCPNSVIVIDEIQKIHPLILSAIEPFLEGLPVGEKRNIETNLATYILTSDFEKEGTTNDKDIEDILQLITVYTRTVFKDFKIMSLVTDIIPFVPLNETSCKTLFKYRIQSHYCQNLRIMGLEDMELVNLEKIQSLLYSKYIKLYPNENFRGVDKILNSYLFNYIQQHLVNHQDEYSNYIKLDSLNDHNNILVVNNNNNKIQQQQKKEENNFIKYGKKFMGFLTNTSYFKKSSCIANITVKEEIQKLDIDIKEITNYYKGSPFANKEQILK